jgi:hypothetical protein
MAVLAFLRARGVILASAIGASALLAACAALQTSATSDRPDGEGYAGTGELVVRIGVPKQSFNPADQFTTHPAERARVEIRYMGLDGQGRAVFQRYDADSAAGSPQAPAIPVSSGAEGAERVQSPDTLPPHTMPIVLDLRLTRQIHVQGKIIEVVQATATGVVFRLY